MADEKKKRNRKKKRGGRKNKMTTEQAEAVKSVSDWLFVGSSSPPSSSSSSLDDFAVTINSGSLRCGEKLVFELHSHSNRSDGFLSPSKLVEKAHNNGVSLRSYGFCCISEILIISDLI